jgi:transcriptional regulator with XRE-family HTH domain
MAEDEGRAQRIAELKEAHPRLTWRKIADAVGVSERAATQWQRTGALKPENAEALAKLFGVDFDYVWVGPRPDTPDLFVDRRASVPDAEQRLARMEQQIAGLIDAVSDVITEAREVIDDFKTYRSEISGQLTGQTGILKRIEAKLGQDEQSADRIEAASAEFDAKFDAAVARASEGLRSASADPPPAAPKTSRKRTPAA